MADKHKGRTAKAVFKTGKERRGFARSAMTLSVRELRPKQKTRQVVSISLGGMYIATSMPYKLGTLAVFEIQLGEAGDKLITPAWVVRCDEQTGMAFEFMAPQLEFSHVLDK